MKSQIVRKILFLILLVILYNVQVFGQGASSSNPIEYTAIGDIVCSPGRHSLLTNEDEELGAKV